MIYGIPPLVVPSGKDKQFEWCKQILLAVNNYSQTTIVRNRRAEYFKYRDMFNGKINTTDTEYITHTFGGEKPATLQHYPLLDVLIKALVGQYMASNFNFTVNKANPNSVSEKMTLEGNMIFEQIAKKWWAKIEQKTGIKVPFEARVDMTPADIKKYTRYNLRDLQEEATYNGIEYIMVTYDLKEELAKLLYGILIEDDSFGKIEVVDGDPIAVNFPAQEAIFDMGVDNYITRVLNQDCDIMGRDRYMTIADVFAEYGDDMDENQKIMLKMNTQRYLSGYYDYNNWGAQVVPNYQAWYYWKYNDAIARVKVVDLQWKAIGDNYLPDAPRSKKEKRQFNVQSMMEKWEGVQIGHDIFIRCRRGKNQIRPATNFKKVELDYFGIQTKESIIRIGWGLQMLYDITMLQIEFLLNQAGGKATVIYLDDIPLGKDGKPKYEVDDIIYMAKVMGVIIKQRKEGVTLRGDSPSYGQVDFGLGNSMQPLIELKTMIEQTARLLTGVNDVRLGFNKPDAGLGVTNNALVQSNFITAPIFNAHSKVSECALNKISTLQKILYPEDEKKAYVLGDMSWKVLKWTKGMALSETGIRVYDSNQSNMKKEKMIALASQALATDPTMILELIKMMNSGSEIEAQKILENGIETIRKINDDMKQQQIDIGRQANQIAAERLKFEQDKVQADSMTGVTKSKLAKEGQVESAQLRKEGMIETAIINNEGKIDQQMLKDTNEEDLAAKNRVAEEVAIE